MRVGHGVVATVRGDHRDPVAIAQLNDQLVGAGAARPAADDQERPLGLPQSSRGLTNGVRVGRLRVGDAVGFRRQRRRRWQLGAQHVARDLDEHRARAAAHGRAERAPQELGNALRLGDLDRLFRHRPEHADQVELLEGVLLIVVERDAADEDHDRRMGDMGRGHAGDEIRGAGTARDQADAGTIGDARQAVGHEGRGLLVAHVDVLDARVVVEPVEDVQKRRADDSKNVPDPLGLQ